MEARCQRRYREVAPPPPPIRFVLTRSCNLTAFLASNECSSSLSSVLKAHFMVSVTE